MDRMALRGKGMVGGVRSVNDTLTALSGPPAACGCTNAEFTKWKRKLELGFVFMCAPHAFVVIFQDRAR